eukprot:1280215-Prymnesium_polylepis.1
MPKVFCALSNDDVRCRLTPQVSRRPMTSEPGPDPAPRCPVCPHHHLSHAGSPRSQPHSPIRCTLHLRDVKDKR